MTTNKLWLRSEDRTPTVCDPAALLLHQEDFGKVRLGRSNDGGYVVCNLGNKAYDLFLSAGIGDDPSFEIAFHSFAKIDCHAFDIVPPTIAAPWFFFYKERLVGYEKGQHSDWYDLLFRHKNIFMKMDIEGAEYAVLETFTPEMLNNIKQLVIEVHDPFSAPRWVCLKRLAETHVLVHLHGNNHGVRDGWPVTNVNDVWMPNLMELTYVRRDMFDQEPDLNRHVLPTDVDEPNNPNAPDIYLGGWPYVRAAQRSLPARSRHSSEQSSSSAQPSPADQPASQS